MLSVLMPVYDEAATVEEAVRRLLAVELPVAFELIVIDDGSRDGTTDILERAGWPSNVTVLHHDRNRGKGAAVRTGLAAARGEITAILDADLEYDAGDLSSLVTPVIEERANAVFGVRAFDGYTSHSFLYVMGNRAVTLVANVLFNVYLRDLMSCHKVIRTDLFRELRLRTSGFSIEPEITAEVLKRGERIFEIPVHYKARATAEGKKLKALDGLRVVGTLVRCRFGG